MQSWILVTWEANIVSTSSVLFLFFFSPLLPTPCPLHFGLVSGAASSTHGTGKYQSLDGIGKGQLQNAYLSSWNTSVGPGAWGAAMGAVGADSDGEGGD